MMDSRQLYKAAEHLRTILTWEKDWIHFGTGDEVNVTLVEELIKNFLQTDLINLVLGRLNSRTIKKREIMPIINGVLGNNNFELWNETMERVIKFHQIGVLLRGEKNPKKK